MGNKFTRKFKLNDAKEETPNEPAVGDEEKNEGLESDKAAVNDASGTAEGVRGQSSNEVKTEPESPVKVIIEEVGASEGAEVETKEVKDEDEVIGKIPNVIIIH